MRRSASTILATVSAAAVAASGLIAPAVALAADPEYRWSEPQTVVSDPTPAVVTDTDVVGALSVAAVTRITAIGVEIDVW